MTTEFVFKLSLLIFTCCAAFLVVRAVIDLDDWWQRRKGRR